MDSGLRTGGGSYPENDTYSAANYHCDPARYTVSHAYTYAAANCHRDAARRTVSHRYTYADANCMGHGHAEAHIDAYATHTDGDTS